MIRRVVTHTCQLYLNRPAIPTFHLLASSPFGPRVLVMHWQDNDVYEVQAMDGDGRSRKNFRSFPRVVVTNPSQLDRVVLEQAALL